MLLQIKCNILEYHMEKENYTPNRVEVVQAKCAVPHGGKNISTK